MALRGALTHRKTRRLAQFLDIPIPCALGVMEALWHVTAECTPTGAIGALSNQDIAEEMFWDGGADTLVDALLRAGLVDAHPEFRLVVHGWEERADQATRRKLSRRGLAMASHDQSLAANGRTCPEETSHSQPHARTYPEPVPEPVPEPEPEPEPEAVCSSPVGSAKASRSASRRAPENTADLWAEFKRTYPPRDGSLNQARAEEVFRKLLTNGTPGEEILAGVRRYRAYADGQPPGKGTGSQFVQQMTTFLNGRHWREPWIVPSRPLAGATVGTGESAASRKLAALLENRPDGY